jgi:hypothetical protein
MGPKMVKRRMLVNALTRPKKILMPFQIIIIIAITSSINPRIARRVPAGARRGTTTRTVITSPIVKNIDSKIAKLKKIR